MILAILRVLALSDALASDIHQELKEPVPPSIALVHSYYARNAATDEVSAELLAVIGFKESRYKPTAKPQCGVTQIAARKNPRRCRQLREDSQAAYYAATEHIEAWLDFCEKIGKGRDLRCAMTGYGPGTKAARTRFDSYALNTLRTARRIANN